MWRGCLHRGWFTPPLNASWAPKGAHGARVECELGPRKGSTAQGRLSIFPLATSKKADSILFHNGKMRNVTCPVYGTCLNDAIRRNLPGFECEGCLHEHDHDDIPENEPIRSIILLCAVFNRYLYRQFIKSDGSGHIPFDRPKRENGGNDFFSWH